MFLIGNVLSRICSCLVKLTFSSGSWLTCFTSDELTNYTVHEPPFLPCTPVPSQHEMTGLIQEPLWFGVFFFFFTLFLYLDLLQTLFLTTSVYLLYGSLASTSLSLDTIAEPMTLATLCSAQSWSCLAWITRTKKIVSLWRLPWE